MMIGSLTNGNIPQSRPSLRSVKFNRQNEKPSETLAERFRELTIYMDFLAPTGKRASMIFNAKT